MNKVIVSFKDSLHQYTYIKLNIFKLKTKIVGTWIQVYS